VIADDQSIVAGSAGNGVVTGLAVERDLCRIDAPGRASDQEHIVAVAAVDGIVAGIAQV
jgi:hypothetical protein